MDAQTPDTATRAFGRAYWMLNSIEMFERLAYFGIRSVVPLYIMQAAEPGGLHLTAVQKGWIYMWWAFLQSWLPLFTGGIADRYGYKRVLVGAISTNAIGYVMMATLHSYHGFFAGILVLATGTAFFKPALQGSIAQNLTKANSSIGWGIFYWVVNVGAVMAPVLATVILGEPHSAEGWRHLFLASAVYTCANLLLLLTFKDVPSGADKSKGLIAVFAMTIENIWPYWLRGGRMHPVRGPLGLLLAVVGLVLFIVASDPVWTYGGASAFFAGCLLATWLAGGTFVWQLRLPAFLLIMACFWMMMYQLWDLHPNFITDWVDSSAVAAWAPEVWREFGDRGLVQVPQQILLNLNAALIVLLIVPVSWAARKMRTLSAMLVGMTVATVGVVVAGLTQSGWILLLGIVFFSLGEMWTGPKKNEYLGLIAPPGKKGLYLGYVNIPIGIGVGIGSLIAGIVYNHWGEKATLAIKELAARPALIARASQSIDWSDALHRLPELMAVERDVAFETAIAMLQSSATPVDAVAAPVEEPAAPAAAAADAASPPALATSAAVGEAAPPATSDPAAYLRRLFRYDSGQIQNLAVLYLAEQPEFAEAVRRGLEEEGAAKERLAAFVHRIPGWAGFSRADAWTMVRESINREASDDAAKGDTEIAAMLWQRFGDDPMVLDNLALEYLAQGTPTLRDRVAAMSFEDPFHEIQTRIGIPRPKAFAALSAAAGADDAAVAAALEGVEAASDDPDARLYVYLMTREHVRFVAVARRDWKHDRAMLAALLEGSESARLADEAAPDRDSAQAALAAKRWSDAPEQAAAILGLNPFEARALAAAEIARAPYEVTQLLWEKYDPQYKVWLPFAAIGVLAAIALAIFGQRAKKWADMNA